MIIEFLLSLLIVCVTSVSCIITSGGLFWELIEPALFIGIPAILTVMIFISGNGRAFLKVFAGAKKIKSAGLKELKQTESAVSFAFKTLIYICLFFMLISTMYFYLNLDETQTLGFNLATVIISIYYMCFFGMILITIRGKLKTNIINFMAEEESVPTAKKLNGRAILFRCIKIVICLAAIIGIYLLIIYSNTVNHSGSEPLSFYNMRDIPGLVYIFIPTLLLITVSGNFKNFFNAIKFCFSGEKLSVTQKSVAVNSIETMRILFFLDGLMCTLDGCLGMLYNLEDRSMLGICIVIACVPLIYGLLVNLILLPVESKVAQLSD